MKQNNDISFLSARLRAMAPAEGGNATPVPYLTACRFSASGFALPDTPALYLYCVTDGSVRLHTPSGILDYTAGQISASCVDMPFCGEVVSLSERGDFLAVCVAFDAEEVLSVVLSSDGDLAGRIVRGEIAPQLSARAEAEIFACLARLSAMAEDGDALAFMAAHLKREILFYALCSPFGSRFLQSIVNISDAGEIYDINDWIKANFRQNFTVADLARRGHMSVSNFHRKFRTAVGMGPLQCRKRLRLSEARRRMLSDNATVTDAALEVGYESVSQFVRDYKKMFGASPKDDVAALRRRLSGGR